MASCLAHDFSLLFCVRLISDDLLADLFNQFSITTTSKRHWCCLLSSITTIGLLSRLHDRIVIEISSSDHE
ncbi:hypothetical protein Plhal304r1_c003g0011621 [Plasmopara halstedii]